MTTVIGVTVYAADDLPGLYCCCLATVRQSGHTNHGTIDVVISAIILLPERKYVTVDHRLFHCAGTVSQDDVFHITVGMYRKRLGTTNLFDTVTFSRSRRRPALSSFFAAISSSRASARLMPSRPYCPITSVFAATVDTVVIAKRDSA